jgi:hypothetical protein
VTEPARSDIPVLLVSGALDPITPPSWAQAALSTLPNARHLVFPDAGHGVFHWSPGCFTSVMLDFLDRPDRFDDGCVTKAAANDPTSPTTLDAKALAALDAALDKGFAASGMPGVAVDLWIPSVGDWVATRGLADRETGRPMTADRQALWITKLVASDEILDGPHRTLMQRATPQSVESLEKNTAIPPALRRYWTGYGLGLQVYRYDAGPAFGHGGNIEGFSSNSVYLPGHGNDFAIEIIAPLIEADSAFDSSNRIANAVTGDHVP